MTAPELERDFFRALNQLVEPWARSGFLAPGLTPWGIILVESTGRRSGEARRVPLVASRFGPHLVVATLRGNRSQWVRNMQANSQVRYWEFGRERTGTAAILAQDSNSGSFPEAIASFARSVLLPAVRSGWTFAVITPAAE